jgi:fused signal recognition particle receptor
MSETRRFAPPRFWRWRRPGAAEEEPTDPSAEPTETPASPTEPAEAVEPPPEEPASAQPSSDGGAAQAQIENPPAPAAVIPEPEPSPGLRGLWRRLGPGAPEPAAETVEPPPEPAEAETTEPRPELVESPEPPSEPAPLVEPPPAAAEAVPEAERRGGWFGRLRAGLQRSSARLNQGINTIFLRRRLDEEALAELEELLIASDMGVGIAEEVTESLRRTRFNQEVAPEEVRAALADQVVRLVEPVMKPLRLDPAKKPFVILVIGVNGSGKTTTIAKLAKQYRDAGLKVVLAAGDTFRAAAVEQLEVWGERVGSRVVSRPPGSDAAGLAYDALVSARDEGADVLLIDTAGRLHNKADLMGELQKIVRVVKKVDAQAPHSVLLVLDATTGQNAHAQAEIFREMVGVTGLVMTKLDGTAKGGVLVSLAEKYGIPIHFLGVGETAEDLRPFEARAYARSLVGLDA